MTTSTQTQTETLTAAQKAARTKGPHAHKAAGLKAQISKLADVAESLTGKSRAPVTRRIKALAAQLSALGEDHEALAA